MPKVSVIIPVYNSQDYLHDCMSSIVNQTLQDIEIICVDDGSKDDSLKILNDYRMHDSRIHILHQENSGAGAARNLGLSYASGDYLSILDCDDFFEPDMLEKSYSKVVSDSLDVLVFGCDFFDNNTREFCPCTYSINQSLLPVNSVFCAKDVQQDVFKLFVGWAWDKLIRREFVKAHGLQFQNLRTSNDMLFVFSALLQAQRIGVYQEVFAHHRQLSGSLSVTREKSWMCFHEALKALKAYMQQIGCFERFEQDYLNYYVHFSMWNLHTLQEPAHTLLYNKLREEWFAEMGLLAHSRRYFYNRDEYLQFWAVYHYTQEQLLRRKKSLAGKIYGGLHCCRMYGVPYTIRLIIRKCMEKGEEKR